MLLETNLAQKHLMRTITDIYMIAEGRYQIDLKSVNLMETVDQWVLNHRDTGKRNNPMVFTVEMPVTLPRVLADAWEIDYILTLFAEAASIHIDHTQPVMHLAMGYEQDVNKVCLTLEGNWPHLPEKDLAQIFDEQLILDQIRMGAPDQSYNLLLAKSLVELMDGWMTMETPPEGKTQFKIHLNAVIG